MSDSKEQTVGQIQQLTDPSVIEHLFKSHYSPLCRTVYKIVRSQQVAEDIVQEVFLKLWNKREELEINVSLKSYLFRSAINTSLNFIGQSKKLEFLEEEDLNVLSHNDVENNYDFLETEKNIKEAIDTLPPACRSVFILSRFEELSYKEIADTLQISVKTVENQMGKALKVLREKLKNYIVMLMISFLLF